MAERVRLAQLRIRATGETEQILEGQTISGRTTRGEAEVFKVKLEPNLHMKVGYVTWTNGERDVRTLEVLESPQAVRRLEHGGLRLEVCYLTNGDSYVVLRQARVKLDTPNKWSNLFKADWDQLDEGCGFDVRKDLIKSGAQEIGTQEEVLGETGRARDFFCVKTTRFPLLPIASRG